MKFFHPTFFSYFRTVAPAGFIEDKFYLRTRILVVEGWPLGTTVATVTDAFPTAVAVGLRKPSWWSPGQAAVYFADAEAAVKAAEKGATLRAKGLSLQWAGVYPKSQFRRPRTRVFFVEISICFLG